MFVLTWFISVYNFSPPTTPKIKTNKKSLREHVEYLETALSGLYYKGMTKLLDVRNQNLVFCKRGHS